MISDMKNRIEREIRSEHNSSRKRPYSPIRSLDRPSMFGGNDEFTVRKQREMQEERRRTLTASPPPNKRDDLMSISPTLAKGGDHPAWQQAVSPLIVPKKPKG